MWIVVVRSEAGQCRIYRQRTPTRALIKALNYYQRQTVRWSDEAESVLLAEYGTISAAQLATKLSGLLGCRVTKNTVIGKYHRIKNRRENGP